MSTEAGLFDALRRLSGTAVSIFQSRLELASLELALERERIFATAALGFIGVLLAVFGVVALSVLIVVLLWDHAGPYGIAAMGLIYLVAGIVLILKVRTHLRNQPLLLESTNAELRHDAAMLRGSPAAAAPADNY